MSKKWKKVPFDHNYEVSSRGRVRSVDRTISKKGQGTARLKGRVLKPWVGSSGYEQVYLSNRNAWMVHHLVLEAFSGPRPEGQEVRHLNGNRLDNSAGNLEWASHLVNMRDRRTHGTWYKGMKTHCPRGHLMSGLNIIDRGRNTICRACNRERSRSHYHGRPFSEELADEDYRLILSGQERPSGRKKRKHETLNENDSQLGSA